MSLASILAAIGGAGTVGFAVVAVILALKRRTDGDTIGTLRLQIANRATADRAAERDQALAELEQTRERDAAQLAAAEADRTAAENRADASATDQELRNELMKPDLGGPP